MNTLRRIVKGHVDFYSKGYNPLWVLISSVIGLPLSIQLGIQANAPWWSFFLILLIGFLIGIYAMTLLVFCMVVAINGTSYLYRRFITEPLEREEEKAQEKNSRF